MARDYSKFTSDELIRHINELEKQLKNDKYGLYWDKQIEKEDVILKCEKFIPTLQIDKSKTILNGGNQNNVLICGDNFESLSCLNMMNENDGFVDLIVTDPPYNTLINDFSYNDKYVNKDDGFKHSKWLNSMYNRFKLARNLLKDTGAILINIDYHEYAQLKLLLDDVFGEENYVECFPRITSLGEKTSIYNINTSHDFILFYVKNSNAFKAADLLKGVKKTFSEYTNPDNDPNGPWKKDSLIIKIDGGRYGYARYPIHNPYTNETYLPPVALDEKDRKQWHYVEPTFNELVAKGAVVFEKTKNYKGKYGFYIKKYLADAKKEYSNMSSLMFLENAFENANGTRMLKKIFNRNNVFPYSKPVQLYKTIINMFDNKNAVVLDFFAGSGTAGQAVLELNQEDGGNRKFILCTNDEGNICTEVTYPRIKTVITGKREDGSVYSEGIHSNLYYFNTDFIEDCKNSDQAKYNLVEKVDYLLCIKENIFTEIYRNDYYSHYTNHDNSRNLFIYFDYYNEDKFRKFKNEIVNFNGEKVVYMYSSDNNIDKSLFDGITNLTVKPIPSKIYEIYKEIIEEVKRGE